MSWQGLVHTFDSVDSTMHVARCLATGVAWEEPAPAESGRPRGPRAAAPEGTSVVAHSQSAGRGRRGRRWASPAHGGLWMTTILRPEGPPASLGSLALLAGAAVLQAVQSLLPPELPQHLQPQLKWPNDVLVGRRKLAGILLEAEDLLGAHPYILVGIGINLAPRQSCTQLPAEVAERYVGLQDLLLTPQRGQQLQPAETQQAEQARPQKLGPQTGPNLQQSLLQAVLQTLQAHYLTWKQHGLAATLAAWHGADALEGHLVRICAAGGTIEGTACGLAADGRLQVRTAQGVVCVLAGEVQLLEAHLPQAPPVAC
jgi:BirA family biotin operon repressor/biotin-[acetyl-CoA-carboxylase] ligase